MFLHRLNRHLFPVEDTCGQGGFSLGLFKDLREVLNLSGTAGGYDRDGYVVTDVVDQLNIKTAIGTILINAVEENFPGTELLTGLCKL